MTEINAGELKVGDIVIEGSYVGDEFITEEFCLILDSGIKDEKKIGKTAFWDDPEPTNFIKFRSNFDILAATPLSLVK